MTLDQADHQFVDAPGGKIHVAVLGEGPPLMLVHGWPQDHRAWRDIAARLSDRYRLILPDLRGFGQSDAPRGDYTKDALATDLLAVLDALELDRVGLAGHDWGAWISFLLALRAPERFTGLAVLNIASPWARPPLNPLRILPLLYMPIVATPGLGPLLMRRTHLVRGLIRGGTAPGVRIDDDAIARFARMIAEPDRARASSALYRHFLLRELPRQGSQFGGRKLEIPTCVIFGTKDPAIHRSMVEGLEHRAPSVEWHWLDDAGHFCAEEQPDRVASALDGFFSGPGSLDPTSRAAPTRS